MSLRSLASCLLFVAVTQTTIAQPPGMPGPSDEHKWLKQFVGQWETKTTGKMGEGQPAIEMTGSITSTMLGGFWVSNTMEANVAGMKIRGMQTIGYDTEKKKYVGTWIDTTGEFMWKYEGSVEKSGKKLVLEAEGPDMAAPDKTRLYRDAYEFTSADSLIVTSSVKNDDGTWTTFMNGKSTRVKKAESPKK